MAAPPRTFTPAEAAHLANVCLAATADERVKPDLSLALDCNAMVARVRAFVGREIATSAVHKAIEENVVKAYVRKDDRLRRHVSEAAVLYLASWKMAKTPLSKEMKVCVYKTLSERMKALRDDRPAGPLVITFSKHVKFDLCEDFERWSTIVRRYERNRSEHIVRDPEIMGGLPVIKGTRVPVYSILSMVEGGDMVAGIREDYPYLSEEAIEAAVVYARAHPRTGRPKRFR